MPKVPPQERDPESDQAAEAASPPSPSDDLSQFDVVFMPPPAPFDRPSEERVDATPSAYPGPELGAGVGGEQPAEHAPATPHTPGGSPASTDAVPSADAIPVSTTGVPHFPPPAAAPAFPLGPGVEAGPGGAGAGEAIATAPPVRRRSILRPFARGLREVAETIVLALLIFLLVRAVVQNFQVEGRSMEPTLETRWYLLVNKALYWEINLHTLNKFIPFIDSGDDPTRYIFRGPRRGDIIVFKSPNQTPGQPERDFIKRIIAVPGETVEVRDCTVFINGEPLDEPYIKERPTYTYGP